MNIACLVFLLTALSFSQRAAAPELPDGRRAGAELRVYEVGDILAQLGPDYPAPKLGVTEDCVPRDQGESAPTPRPAAEPTAAELEARCVANAKILVDMLRMDVQPRIPDDSDVLRCVAQGALMANLTPEQHAWTGAFLERLRRFEGHIEVEIRLVEGPAGVMEAWGIGPNSVLKDQAAIAALDERIKKSPRFNLLTAPRLAVLPLQRASLSTLNAVTFVRDWSVEIVEPDQQEIAVPRIGLMHEGFAVDVRAIPLGDDEFRIDFHWQNAKVRRPIRTASVPLGKDKHMVEVALPEADVARGEAKVAILSGSAVVLVTPGMEQGMEQMMIVAAKRVPRSQR